MKMFISPPSETTWKTDPDELALRLVEFSAGITVRREKKHSSSHSLEWTWSTPEGPIEGSLSAGLDCVILDGDLRRCAEFAAWFRTTVPLDQALVLYDEGYSADVALEAGVSAEALVAPFVA